MKWAKSLIRISKHEVETLQKRLAEVMARRWAVEVQIDSINAELLAEAQGAGSNAEAGLYLIGFRDGAKLRLERLRMSLLDLDAEQTSRARLGDDLRGDRGRFGHITTGCLSLSD